MAACLAGAALLLPAERLSPASALAAESPRLDVGNRFPAVELTSLAGVRGRIAPDSPLPNATVLVFFAPQCAKCFKEMAYLEEVYEAARDRGIEVLAVEASGQSAERTRVIMEQYRKFYPLPRYWVFPDPDFKVSRLFGVGVTIPQTFLVNRGGVIVAHTDKFVQGPANALTRKIELAFDLEPGFLQQRRVSGLAPFVQSPEAAEAPSVLVMENKCEDLREAGQVHARHRAVGAGARGEFFPPGRTIPNRDFAPGRRDGESRGRTVIRQVGCTPA